MHGTTMISRFTSPGVGSVAFVNVQLISSDSFSSAFGNQIIAPCRRRKRKREMKIAQNVRESSGCDKSSAS